MYFRFLAVIVESGWFSGNSLLKRMRSNMQIYRHRNLLLFHDTNYDAQISNMSMHATAKPKAKL